MKKCENVKKVFVARLTELGAAENASAFARTCGLKQQDISRYLTQGALPVSDKLVQIATRFGVSADWLLGLSDTRHTTAAAPQPQPATPQPPPPDTRWFDLVASQQATIATLTQALAAPKPAPAAPAGGTTATKTA